MASASRSGSARSADRAQLSFYVETLLDGARSAADAQRQEPALSNMVEVYAPEDLEQLKVSSESETGNAGRSVKRVLNILADRGAHWPSSATPQDGSLLDLGRRFPNFAAPIEDIRRAAALARLAPGSPLVLAPMLLDGSPGIGKSHFAREVAAALRVPMQTFSMAQATASFGLGGLNTQYDSGGPGYLVRSFADGGVPDPVVVVDELDKAAVFSSHDPTRPLYELLEAGTAARFVDDGLRMPLNLGAIRWIATCNDPDLIAEPLRSRFLHYEIQRPTPAQMRDIAARAYREVVTAGAWSRHFDSELPDDVADALATGVPRDLARTLRAALGAAALAGRSTIRVGDMPSTRSTARMRMGFA